MLGWLFLILSLSGTAYAEAFDMAHIGDSKSLMPYFSFLEQSKPNQNPRDLFDDSRWQAFPKDQKSHNFGINSNIYWLKSEWVNTSSEAQSLYLVSEDHRTDQLDFYIYSGQDLIAEKHTGDYSSFLTRGLAYRGFAFLIQIEAGASRQIYLRYRSTAPIEIDLQAYQVDRLEKYAAKLSSIGTLYLGAMLSIILFNLFLFISSRERLYAVYCVFQIFSTGAIAIVMGVAFELLWPGSPQLNAVMSVFMPCMSTAMALIFCSHYLVLPEKSKWLTLIVWMTAGLLICVGVLSFIVALPLLIRLMYIFLIPAIIQVLIVPLILAFKKDRFAKLFLIAWLPLVIGALTFTLIRLGMTVDIPQGAELAFGSIWEAVFLSVCLGDKFNQIKKQEINYLERIRQEEMLAREAEILAESRHREKLIIEREAVANRNLVRVIVHDIANPLNIILNYSDVIDRNDLNVVDAQKYLQKIHKAAEHQHEIIEHVRELEALNSGKMRIKLVPVSVQESIDTLKDFLQKKFEDKNIVFDVIGSDPELYVMAEQRSFVYNVLANLVSNAIKFSPDGSHIRCEIEASEKFVNMTIADQGIGMEADLLAQIFEISSPTTRLGLNGEKGTGFGLPIVKSYIDKYEAQLLVESRAIENDALHHGTRFTLILVRGFPSDLAGQ